MFFPKMSLHLTSFSIGIVAQNCFAKSPEHQMVPDGQAVAASNAIYGDGFVKVETSLFVERFTTYCCMMAPNAPSLCGPDVAGRFPGIACGKGQKSIGSLLRTFNSMFKWTRGNFMMYTDRPWTMANTSYFGKNKR